MLCVADSTCCGTADGQGGPAALAACAARRWLARYAAGVKLISNISNLYGGGRLPPTAYASLVSCLPALESARLRMLGPLAPDNVGFLLEALASRPALTALDLLVRGVNDHDDKRLPDALGCAPAFAKLRSLKHLALNFGAGDRYTLGDVVGALVSLTGLTELHICLPQPTAVPAALGQLKALQALQLCALKNCVLEAGCLDLPKLQRLRFANCKFVEDENVELLPSVTALQSLTSIDLNDINGPPCFAQLVHLPRLQRMDYFGRPS